MLPLLGLYLGPAPRRGHSPGVNFASSARVTAGFALIACSQRARSA
ncbi:hypothetical protein [Sorangium sp. So ce124]